MRSSLAALFPGQGAYFPGALAQDRMRHRQIPEVFEEVDAVAAEALGGTVSEVIFSPAAPALGAMVKSANEVLQLAIYGISVASYRVLESRGVEPAMLVGHSFGEIAALVGAGGYSVEAGARMICDRNRVLREMAEGSGYMLALAVGAERAEHLVALAGVERAAVAVENGGTQTVVSGSTAAMELLEGVAERLGITSIRLDSAYPFHSPVLRPAVAELAARLRRYERRPLRVPVYSPIVGRRYTDADDLAECLAGHLVGRVRFADGLRALYERDGIRSFVECGALGTLSKAVRHVLPGGDVTVVTLLERHDPGSFAAALERLTPAGGRAEGATLSDEEFGRLFERFWAARGAELLGLRERGAPVPAPLVVEVLEAVEAVEAVAAPVGPAAAPASGAASAPTRGEVVAELTAMYAQALEYPPEVFTEEVHLEAELGIDSVKQTELFARVAERYALPPRPAGFRPGDYQHFGAVTDFVLAQLAGGGGAPLPATAAAQEGVEAPAPAAGGADRGRLLEELRATYAQALEYPPEVFTEEVHLEAELGIDSVKQTELFARVAERYGLPPSPAHFRLNDYPTLGKIVDFIAERAPAPTVPA